MKSTYFWVLFSKRVSTDARETTPPGPYISDSSTHEPGTIVPVENRNDRLPTFDFTRFLYVEPNVGSSALYSASDALYSALLPTLDLTYRKRVKSNVGNRSFLFSTGTTI